uniref:Short-chain dehydrogenase n=1 Tax=Parastrongyloides trichosuri TaxID=131310 RepID=A0A0N4ZXK5_PARTI
MILFFEDSNIDGSKVKGCAPLHRQIFLSIRFFFIYFYLFLTRDVPRLFLLKRKCVQGQVVVITGGGMGIGKKLAEEMSIKERSKVVILDVNEVEGLKTKDEIEKNDGKVYFYKCNVTKSEEIEKVKDDIINNPELGKIDILICNAAVLKFGELMELSENDYKINNDVNILGYILTTKIFLKEMLKVGKGQIVFMGSICSFYGDYCGTAYCTAKFAIRGFMESLRIELLERGNDNIRTTIIHPYFVKTSLVTNQIKDPYSTFFDVISVDECVELTMDAILKERFEAFIPNRLSIFCYFLKCFQTVGIFKEAKEFLNFKHDPI